MKSLDRRIGRATACAAAASVIALGTQAQTPTVGVTVGAGQSVTNSANLTPNIGVEFTGDGGTFTNSLGATITAVPDVDGHSKIASGPDFDQFNIPFNNLTINNAGTLEYTSNPGSGAYFAGNPVYTGAVQTGITTVSGITVNNEATGVIAGLDTSNHHDDTPLSFEDGVNGAVVNNAGTISTAGTSLDGAGVRVEGGDYAFATSMSNITINNEAGGIIQNTGAGTAIALHQGSLTGSISGVTINNAGAIVGGPSVDDPTFGNVALGAIALTAGNSRTDPAQISGATIANTGTIDGSASGVAIDNAHNADALSVISSGTIKGEIKLGLGADQISITGGTVTADVPIVFGGNGQTVTVGAGAKVEGVNRIASGPDLVQNNIPFSNLTINNSGTLQQDQSGFCCSGMYFSNGGTGPAISGITINNFAGGAITSLQTTKGPPQFSPGDADGRPISFESGVTGAVVNNAGTISSAGISTDSGAIHVGDGASGVTINNLAGGVLSETGTRAAIRLDDESGHAAANVSIANAGTIIGGSGEGAIALGSENPGSPVAISGVTIANTGTIDGSASGVAIDNSTNADALSVTSSGTIKGDVRFGSGGDQLMVTGGTITGNVVGQGASGETVTFDAGANTVAMNGGLSDVSAVKVLSGATNFGAAASTIGSYAQSGGSAILHGGAITADQGFTITGGVFGGQGTITAVNGSVTVDGGTLQVGASPDQLTINGDFVKNGGTITFEIDADGIDPSGHPQFVTSTLVLDQSAHNSITDADILFDFVGGADPLAFLDSGDFRLDTFLPGLSQDGLDFASDHFLAAADDFTITNFSFDADLGATELAEIADVPEPGSLSLIAAALAGLGLLRRRKRT